MLQETGEPQCNEVLLTLGVSTLGKNLNQAIAIFEHVKKTDNVELLIAVQGQVSERANSYSNAIRIEYLDNMGLSRSRNAVLDRATGRYVWLLDDDVILNNEFIDTVLASIRTAAIDTACLLGRIGCSDADGLYKTYDGNKNKLLSIAGASSIEMVLNRPWLHKNGIRFNELFGLGSRHNSGEEFILLNNIRRSGGKIAHITDVIVKHPCHQQGRITVRQRFSDDDSVECRAAIAREAGGGVSLLLFFYWLMKVGVKSRSMKSMRLFVKTYAGYQTGN